MPYVPTGSSCTVPKASSSGGWSYLGEYPFLKILHQDKPPFVLEHSAQFWVLTLQNLHPDCSLLCLHLLWHLADPLVGDLSQALLCHLAVECPITSLATLALGRQCCKPQMQDAKITAMTTPLAESINAN